MEKKFKGVNLSRLCVRFSFRHKEPEGLKHARRLKGLKGNYLFYSNYELETFDDLLYVLYHNEYSVDMNESKIIKVTIDDRYVYDLLVNGF